MIIKFSLDYVEFEDEMIQYADVFKSANRIKKCIKSFNYPLKDVTPDIVKNFFSNIVVIDNENYVVVINLQNRELTSVELKKAATVKPLLQSKCKSFSNDLDYINWKIVLQ